MKNTFDTVAILNQWQDRLDMLTNCQLKRWHQFNARQQRRLTGNN